MTLSLGIDLGTSGVRAAALDEDQNCIAMARADHLPQSPNNIGADLWWHAVCTCLSRLAEALGSTDYAPADVAHLSVDGTSGTMVLTDAALRPVSRALMYDSRGFEAEAERIRKYAPADHITQGEASALARVLRLLSEAPDATFLMHQADFVVAKLTGVGGQSDVMNALKTGVDPETGMWPDWIAELCPLSLLPRTQAIGTPVGQVTSHELLGLGYPGSAMVHAGTTDSIAAFLAAAPLEEGMAVTSLGSTLAVKMLCAERIDDPTIGLYSHRVGDVWLVGGASNSGGRVLAAYFTPEQISELCQLIDPKTTTGLDFYPLLEPGERFPRNDPSLKPRLEPRPASDAEFLQAMFEGIAQIEAQCYAAIKARGGGTPRRVLSAGGASQNSVFNEIRTQALGLAPEISVHTEAAIGAAKIPKLATALF